MLRPPGYGRPVSQSPLRTPRTRVLVADDQPIIARCVSDLLLESGKAEVLGPVNDGNAALALFHRARPDGAILDISMPGLSGIDVLRAIRASGQPCFVIIFTAHDEPSIRDGCIAAGADRVMCKTSEFEQVLEIIHLAAPMATKRLSANTR